jgi:hypothetical protein
MDLNGGRRRIPLIEEPRRPPWMLIILLVAAAVVIAWVISNLRIGTDGDEDAAAPAPTPAPVSASREAVVERVERIPVRPPSASGDPLVVVRAEAPRWDRHPAPDFPEEGFSAPGGKGRVTLTCVVQSNRGLGDCVILEEDPPGHGFAAAAIRAARRARLTDESRPGAQVTYTTRFIPSP